MKHSLLLLVGFPGSGKSTVGKAIAASLKAVYIDKDTICSGFTGRLLEMNGESPDSRDNSEFYKKEIMPLEYETLFKIAHDNLECSEFVLIDAPFVRYLTAVDFIEKQKQIFHWPNINVIVLEVSANLETIRQRLVQRGEKRDLWKLENWETFSKGIENNLCNWEGIHQISFDNSHDQSDINGLLSQIKLLHN